MMLVWATKARADTLRLYEFLASKNLRAAKNVMQDLILSADSLKDNPQKGLRLKQFNPKEIRRIIVKNYEIRYELQANKIVVLRVWHTREFR